MPMQMVKHYFPVCLWGCLQKRTAFKSVDIIKITLTNVNGLHLILWRPGSKEKVEKRQSCSLSLSCNIHLLDPATWRMYLPGREHRTCTLWVSMVDKRKSMETSKCSKGGREWRRWCRRGVEGPNHWGPSRPCKKVCWRPLEGFEQRTDLLWLRF